MAPRGETEEVGYLSMWGLIKESVKVFHSRTELFVSLTLTFILPLYAVGLGHTFITEPLVNSIVLDQLQLVYVQDDARRVQAILKDLREELFKILAVLVLYVLVVFTLCLFATSAIVYSVACVYLEKITCYKKVLSAVPHVCKRLIVTVLWAVLLMSGYVVVCCACISIITTLFVLLSGGSQTVLIVVLYARMIGIWVGAIYLNCVWHLANVVTVLEEGDGLAAMGESLNLIKGKRLVAVGLSFVYSATAFLMGYAYARWVWHGASLQLLWKLLLGEGGWPGASLQLPWRVLLGIALTLMLSFWYLLMGLILQTVFYFACKAHHHQNIDRFKLLHHLAAYTGEDYLPLKNASSIQLEPL